MTKYLPLFKNILLYDKQHLITLKSLIFDDKIDYAITFANRFDFNSMSFDFNSIVIGLYCQSGLYFKIIHIIVHYFE